MNSFHSNRMFNLIYESTLISYDFMTLFQSIHQHPKAFQQLLEKVPDTTPVVIIIDGLDLIRTPKSHTFDWLPKQLPAHIRILLTMTTDCDIHTSIKVSKHLEIAYISCQNPLPSYFTVRLSS